MLGLLIFWPREVGSFTHVQLWRNFSRVTGLLCDRALTRTQAFLTPTPLFINPASTMCVVLHLLYFFNQILSTLDILIEHSDTPWHSFNEVTSEVKCFLMFTTYVYFFWGNYLHLYFPPLRYYVPNVFSKTNTWYSGNKNMNSLHICLIYPNIL